MAKDRLSILEGELKLQSGPVILRSLLDIIGLYVQQAQQTPGVFPSFPNREEVRFYVDQAVQEAKCQGRQDKRDQFLRFLTTQLSRH